MKKPTGTEKFNLYFNEVYKERWPNLKEAMCQPEKQVVRFCFNSLELEENKKFQPHEIEWLKNCIWYDSKVHFGLNNQLSQQAKRTSYILNPASIIAASSLKIEPSDKVLDMCAAPGGKTLILAESLTTDGELWANEISMNRRVNLTQVIRSYIPNILRNKVFTKGKDGLQYGIKHPGEFDKILIDAPCSGERHLLKRDDHISKWSPKRTKRLSSIQYGLLCSGLLSLKPGGSIVYSTCSISPYENDDVIQKLLDKKGSQFELDLPESPTPFAEKTKYGFMHLPDKCGFGPIYFTRLKKKS